MHSCSVYYYNHIGSTVILTDEDGSIEETYRYSAYGTVLDGNTAITPYLYNGQYGVSTGADGLNYMRARYYDSVSGRYINRDTVSGTIEDSRSLNRYAYCYGNPVSYADPFGLSPLVLMRNHAILDVIGMIPGLLGMAADLANVVIYVAEGNYVQAVMSTLAIPFSIMPKDIVNGMIGVVLGGLSICGSAVDVYTDIKRDISNWDYYTDDEKCLEAQILVCHMIGLGCGIIGTLNAADSSQKADKKTDYNKKADEVQKNLTDPTEPKYDAATAKRVDELVSGGKVSESSGYKSGSNTALTVYDPEFAAKQLLVGGETTEDLLRSAIPQGTPNTFVQSTTIKEGYKYNFSINGKNMEIKWHSQDLNAAAGYPGSNSGAGWTAQIKVGNKLLTQYGSFVRKPQNYTHIPLKGGE